MSSFVSKVLWTIIVSVCWFVVTVLYLAFFAGSFDFWQKLAIFLASGAVVLGGIAVFWIKWVVG
jgi:hypothetical protein